MVRELSCEQAMFKIGLNFRNTNDKTQIFKAELSLASDTNSRAGKRGGFKRGGFPIWNCSLFFVLFCPFLAFWGLSRCFRGLSRLVLFLFLGPLTLLEAPTRNSPKRICDTKPPPFGNPAGLPSPKKLLPTENDSEINSFCRNYEFPA